MNPFELKIFKEVDAIAGEVAGKVLNGFNKDAVELLLSSKKTKALMVLCCLQNHLDKSHMETIYKLLLNKV